MLTAIYFIAQENNDCDDNVRNEDNYDSLQYDLTQNCSVTEERIEDNVTQNPYYGDDIYDRSLDDHDKLVDQKSRSATNPENVRKPCENITVIQNPYYE